MNDVESAVLTAGLAGVGPDAAPVTIDAADLDGLLHWVATERLFGLLVAALEHGSVVVGDGSDSGDGDANHAAMQRAGDAHRSALRSTLAAEATAVHAVRALRSEGIEAYVFKGLATAHLDYPDPAIRSFYDADLHVLRADFGAAIDALVAAGYIKSPTPMSDRWERRFARACEMRSPDGVELDLHAAVATGYFGTVLDHERLRHSPAAVVLAGDTVSAFSLPARALISAYGVVLSRGPGLRLQRDVAQQLTALGDRWPELVDLAGDHGAAVIGQALDVIGSSCGVDTIDSNLVRCAADASITPDARRALELARSAATSGWSADARSTMMALPAGERLRFAADVVVSKARRRRSAS